MSEAKIETMVMITGREYEALRAEVEKLRAEVEKLRAALDEAQREITQLYEDAAGESM